MNRVLAAACAAVVAVALPVLSVGTASATPATSRIAFADGSVYLVDADGSGLHAITSDDDDASPSFSPDGSQVAYVHAGEVWVTRDGGTARQVTHTGGTAREVAWSPNGTWLAFTAAAGAFRDVFKVHPAGGTAQRMTFVATRGCYAATPAWSPDSTRIAYQRIPSGTGSCTSGGVVVQKLGGSGSLRSAGPRASRRSRRTASTWCSSQSAVWTTSAGTAASAGSPTAAAVVPTWWRSSTCARRATCACNAWWVPRPRLGRGLHVRRERRPGRDPRDVLPGGGTRTRPAPSCSRCRPSAWGATSAVTSTSTDRGGEHLPGNVGGVWRVGDAVHRRHRPVDAGGARAAGVPGRAGAARAARARARTTRVARCSPTCPATSSTSTPRSSTEPQVVALGTWARRLHDVVAGFAHPGPWRFPLGDELVGTTTGGPTSSSDTTMSRRTTSASTVTSWSASSTGTSPVRRRG